MPTRPATPSAVQPARLFDSRGDLDHPFEETIEPATLARPPSDSGAGGAASQRRPSRRLKPGESNDTSRPPAVAGPSPCSAKLPTRWAQPTST